MFVASSLIMVSTILVPPARSDWPPRTTVEELNTMVKAGNYHRVRTKKIAHQIEASGVVQSVGHWPLLKLPGGWWAHLHNVPKDHGLKVGDRVKFRALIVDEAYKGLQLWTYSWSKVEAKADHRPRE